MLKTIESITHDFQPGDVFIDVGGNVGAWTIEMLGLYDRTIFIDPSVAATDQAKINIKTHCEYFNAPELINRVTYHRNLCSSVAGERHSIAATTEDTGNFSIYAESLYGSNNIRLSETDIETITLDKFLPEIKEGGKVLIKIDTEGCDLDVILGGWKLIEKFKPLVIVEMHWHMHYDQEKRDRVFQLFNSLGYTYKDFLFAGYALNPTTIFDGKHNGKQMEKLHFQMMMIPPAN
jgi:FkbM family methyltransferase